MYEATQTGRGSVADRNTPACSIFDIPAEEPASLVAAFAEETGFLVSRALTAREAGFADILTRIHHGEYRQPILFRGLAVEWPALRRWNRQYLLSRWGETCVSAAVGLPVDGAPFFKPEAELRRILTLRAFWEEMDTAGRCWVEELPVSILPGLEDDLNKLDLFEAKPSQQFNLWLGRGTKSGLHYDPAGNFLVMVSGCKLVALASPDESVRLYPVLDSIMKSQVNVEHPDFSRFPRARAVDMQVGRLTPGDVLYIPAGWWHYLSSSTATHHISVNCWFGQELSLGFLASQIFKLGPRYGIRIIQDFLLRGLLGRPYVPIFHAQPNGVQLYRKIRDSLRG